MYVGLISCVNLISELFITPKSVQSPFEWSVLKTLQVSLAKEAYSCKALLALMCCGVWQDVAGCCRMLQVVAMCLSLLQKRPTCVVLFFAMVRCRVLQGVAGYCVALCRSVSQCVAVCLSLLQKRPTCVVHYRQIVQRDFE